MTSMIRSKLTLVLIIASTVVFSCEKRIKKNSGEMSVTRTAQKADPADSIVAKVDGVPILASDLEALTQIADGGLDQEKALETLIRNQLLANEAEKRGYGTFLKVKDAQKTAMARVLLEKQIGEETNEQTLDELKLKKLYELNKHFFVHGLQVRVDHLVILFPQKGQKSRAALELAQEIAKEAQNSRFLSEDDFIKFGEATVKKHGVKKVKLERLAPFDKETKKFVEKFVEASFNLKKIGSVSSLVETKFGYHIIYLAEEYPALNLSFEEARDTVVNGLLPRERKQRAKQLMDSLRKSGDIFIHEEAVGEWDLSR